MGIFQIVFFPAKRFSSPSDDLVDLIESARTAVSHPAVSGRARRAGYFGKNKEVSFTRTDGKTVFGDLRTGARTKPVNNFGFSKAVPSLGEDS